MHFWGGGGESTAESITTGDPPVGETTAMGVPEGSADISMGSAEEEGNVEGSVEDDLPSGEWELINIPRVSMLECRKDDDKA